MCRPVRCKKCGNITWAGCGRHVADVKASVPAELWCPGHAADPTKPKRTWLRRRATPRSPGGPVPR